MEFGNFELEPFGSSLPEDDKLQRTEAWFKARSGNFTGSKMHLLMGCGRSTGKLPWGDPAKLMDFGATAEKYIYNVGKERLTGNRSQQVSSQEMRYGNISEPLLINKLLEEGIIKNYEPCSFAKIEGYSSGASADGTVVYKDEKVGLETKCCVSWDGHYKRKYNIVDQKHDDFWQFQTEMKALGVDKLLYVVADPMTIEDYEIEIIEASPIHQQAMLDRIQIADLAIGYWSTYKYAEALQVACAEWEG